MNKCLDFLLQISMHGSLNITESDDKHKYLELLTGLRISFIAMIYTYMYYIVDCNKFKDTNGVIRNPSKGILYNGQNRKTKTLNRN